jgi:endo-1,4-beta-mannosidase
MQIYSIVSGKLFFQKKNHIDTNIIYSSQDFDGFVRIVKIEPQMKQFVLKIVSRYKTSNTILFWELVNELNLQRTRSSLQFLSKEVIKEIM